MSSDHPIRHLVVLGHPTAGSFNHSMADIYCQTVQDCGQEAELRDLYALGFDPLLKTGERPDSIGSKPAHDVADELAHLRRCDVVTLVYPIWFGMPPAIIKGYVDRVLGSGFAAMSIRRGLKHVPLQDKRLVILSSSATARQWLEEQGQWLSLRRAFDTYLTTVFGFAGEQHVHFDSIVEGTKPRYIDECLEELRGKTRSICADLLSARHRAHGRQLQKSR